MKIFKNIIVVAIAGIIVCSAYAAGGVQLDRSRVMIKDGKSNSSYAVENHYDAPLLVSAVVTNFDGTPATAFAVSPALYQIKPKSTFQSQVVQLESLPQDRESVYWLNVRTVLASDTKEEEKKNTIELAIAQRIKVFYRPKGINENCASAVEKLEWTKTSKGVMVKNPSPVAISLVKVISGDKVSSISDTLMPFEQKEWKVFIKGNVENKFTFVDEYGNFIDKPVKFK